jgi:hypothetical protein
MVRPGAGLRGDPVSLREAVLACRRDFESQFDDPDPEVVAWAMVQFDGMALAGHAAELEELRKLPEPEKVVLGYLLSVEG